MASRPRTVAVIGAGAAGIAAARVLRGAGAAVTVLEQAHEVGGVWCREGEPGSGMHVGLQTNLPNQVMGFGPEFPMPSDDDEGGGGTPSFVSVGAMRDYLQEHARAEEILPLVELGTRVVRAEPATWDGEGEGEGEGEGGGGGEGGGEGESESGSGSGTSGGWNGWNVTTRSVDGTNTSDERRERRFDWLVVANGHYNMPFVPPVAGLKEHFVGRAVHSSEVVDMSAYAGQTIIVVGAQASGTDIALKLSRQPGTTVIVADRACGTRQEDVTNRAGRAASSAAAGAAAAAAGGGGAGPTAGDRDGADEVGGMREGMRGCDGEDGSGVDGAITWSPPLTHVEEGSHVVFADGHHCDDADLIVFACGYLYDFDFFDTGRGGTGIEEEGGAAVGEEGGDRGTGGDDEAKGDTCDDKGGTEDGLDKGHPLLTPLLHTDRRKQVHPLYRHIFHCDMPTLAFIGIPWSVVPFPLFELQSRLIAAVMTGELGLPSRDQRWLALEAQYGERDAGNMRAPRHQDTHRFGPLQWVYSREIVQDLYPIVGSRDRVTADAAIDLNEAIYNDVGR